MSAQTTRATTGQHSARVRRGHQSVLAWADLFSARMTIVLVLLAVLLVTGVWVIYTTFKSRYLLNELQQLKNQRNELQVQWGQLLIEQSTFSLEGRIERKAMDELQMEVPDFSEIVMVRYE